MLKSVGLENYKCFENEIIDIAPLTILCGVNSSGKSSILKSLLMLKQSYENTLSANEITFNGKYVDNGFFENNVRHGSGNSFSLANTFEIYKPADRTRGIWESDATSYNELLKIFKRLDNDSKRKINCFRFEIKLSVSGSINKSDISQKFNNTIDEYEIAVTPFHIDNNNYNRVNNITKIILKRNIDQKNSKRSYDVFLHYFPYDFYDTTEIFNNTLFNCTCYFEGIKLVKLYQVDPMIDNISLILPNIYSLFRIVSYQYSNINHV